VLVIAKSLLRGEPASIIPVALLDPLKLFFIRSPEGIRNSLVPEKVDECSRESGFKPVRDFGSRKAQEVKGAFFDLRS
jgi:hypothetical protein